MIYLQLIFNFFQIGLFSFGGGYAVLPLIRQQIVETQGWLTLQEFTDVVAISQMTPGPIALNAATFVGVRIAGWPGGIAATLGCTLPSCIIVLILARYFFKYREIPAMQSILRGLRPAVVALIAVATYSIVLSALLSTIPARFSLPAFGDIEWISVGIFVLSLVLLRVFKVKIMHLMAGAGLAGILIYTVIL